MCIEWSDDKEVLVIAPDGAVRRRGIPVEDLTREELLVVISELVDLISRRKW